VEESEETNMKQDIHPQWYPEAQVTCSCGNTWVTGATVAEIRTDICSACHPFFTGEQRIVDTEGQVDRFLKRLKVRDDMRAAEEAKVAARTPADLPLAELGVGQRYLNVLSEQGIEVVADLLRQLEEGGDQSVLDFPGIGRKVLSDLKKGLRSRGYELPQTE
jgi:large subunit ribosomal protein L31